MSVIEMAYCTQQTQGLTRGMTLRGRLPTTVILAGRATPLAPTGLPDA
jgi:hypothetical protein